MLEIFIGSSLWSLNIGSDLKSEPAVLMVIEQSAGLDRVNIANGRPYESNYERDAERERKERDIWNHGGSDRERERDRDRSRYDTDDYRREVETERIYREPDGRESREDNSYRRERERDRDRSRYDTDDYRRESETERIYRRPN